MGFRFTDSDVDVCVDVGVAQCVVVVDDALTV